MNDTIKRLGNGESSRWPLWLSLGNSFGGNSFSNGNGSGVGLGTGGEYGCGLGYNFGLIHGDGTGRGVFDSPVILVTDDPLWLICMGVVK